MFKNKPLFLYEEDGGKGGGGEPEPPKKQEGNIFTQKDVDNIVAKSRKELEEQLGDYDKTKSELEKLLKEKKEREDAELSEIEKLKKQLDEKDSLISDLSKYKEQYDARIKALTEKRDGMLDDLEDEQKEIALAISDVEKSIAYIKSLESAKGSPPGGAPAGKTGNELADILAITDPTIRQNKYNEWRRRQN